MVQLNTNYLSGPRAMGPALNNERARLGNQAMRNAMAQQQRQQQQQGQLRNVLAGYNYGGGTDQAALKNALAISPDTGLKLYGAEAERAKGLQSVKKSFADDLMKTAVSMPDSPDKFPEWYSTQRDLLRRKYGDQVVNAELMPLTRDNAGQIYQTARQVKEMAGRMNPQKRQIIEGAGGFYGVDPMTLDAQRLEGVTPKPPRGMAIEFDAQGRPVRVLSNAEQGSGGPMNDAYRARSEGAEYGKALVKNEYVPIVEAANQSMDLNNKLRTARDIDIQPGKLAPAKAWLGNLAQDIGIDPAALGLGQVDNLEAFRGVMSDIVLKKAESMKGQLSDRDIKFLQNSTASITNTPDAKDFMIESMIATNNRTITKRSFYDAWQTENGTFQGAADAWREYAMDMPVGIKDPATGRPIFFHEFVKNIRRAYEGDVTMAEIERFWKRKAAASAR